jgi:hypothetical protein
MVSRILQERIEKMMFKNKVIIVYGARRVGKTTMVNQILQNNQSGKYFNCDLLQVKSALETTNSTLLHDFIGDSKLIVLDEAQQIENIGKILKIMIDNFPGVQIIATGSSSFELANTLSEPLTGRSRQFVLFPFSMEELHEKEAWLDLNAKLNKIIVHGLYPEVYGLSGDEAIEELQNISSNYLYKDVLQLSSIKRPDLILKLMKALALQVGSEYSLNEIAVLLGENVHTIKKYIEILEQAFVIFNLKSFSRNLRKELGKRNKVFFYDNGIRNSILMNFNQLDSRNDTGQLWENFCISERLKHNNNHRQFKNIYFWRTYSQVEIDYIEEYNGELFAYEFKWGNTKRKKPPKEFLEAYENSVYQVIDRDNYIEFITGKI